MKVISVQGANGGVGVTATAAELALAEADAGKRVLAVDTNQRSLLSMLLKESWFHYLDDVRQLFRPLSHARWTLPAMPRRGLLCVPEQRAMYRTAYEGIEDGFGYMPLPGIEADALVHARAAIADLAPHYDVMIVDVRNKSRPLMQLFHDVCDEVHLMLRANPGFGDTVANWRCEIERTGGDEKAPYITAHQDRSQRIGSDDGFEAWLTAIGFGTNVLRPDARPPRVVGQLQ